MKADRIEKLRLARNVNEVLALVGEIQSEFDERETSIRRLQASLSGVIRIDHHKAVEDSDVQLGEDGYQIPNYKAPAKREVSKLLKDNALLTDARNSLHELDLALAVLRQGFASSSPTKLNSAVRAVEALRKETSAQIDTLTKELLSASERHRLPSSMQKIADALHEHVLEVVDSETYDDIRAEKIVSADEEGSLVFTHYTHVVNLKNAEGYIFDDYCITLTGIVSVDGRARYYVNALPEYKTPGAFPIGRHVSGERQAQIELDLILAHNHFIADHKRQGLHVELKPRASTIANAVRGVEELDIKNDKFIIKLKPTLVKTESKARTIAETLREPLTALFGQDLMKKNRLNMRIHEAVLDELVIRCPKRIDLTDADDIRSVLGAEYKDRSVVFTLRAGISAAASRVAVETCLQYVSERLGKKLGQDSISTLGQFVIEITLAPREIKAFMQSRDRMIEMRNMFGLTESEERALRFALQHRKSV